MSDPSGSRPSEGPSQLFQKLAAEYPDAARKALRETPPAAAEVAAVSPHCPPPGFPAGIEVRSATYENWSLAIDVPDLCIASVSSADQVAAIANWARGAGYKVRALGHSHNWSPLVVPGGTSSSDPVVLVDTSGLKGSSFHADPRYPIATFGVGVTVDEATQFLQQQDNGGTGSAPGYSFQNMTAPGGLSLGGVLAIGAHGTGLPFERDGRPVVEPRLNGCMSNLVVSFKAVVTAPGSEEYAVREFRRDEADAAAFLVHLGRAFLTEVTLRVIPNYYLQVVNWYPQADVLFEAPGGQPSSESLSALLDRYGRLEVIWFPFTSEPWVKTWERMEKKIEPQVAGPYNYPWANNISITESNAIKFMLQVFPGPSVTEFFGKTQLAITQLNAPHSQVLNGTSRDLLLYVLDTTLRVTAYGYALQIRRDQVQAVAHEIVQQYTSMLTAYADAGKYPVNGPVELRFTTMDYLDDLGVAGAVLPALSVCRSIDPDDAGLDTVFWFDSLTLPGTEHAGEFFAELEAWMKSQYGTAANNVMRPEWSKGWAYTAASGAWTDQQVITQDIPAHWDQPAGSQVYQWAEQTLARYDRANLYTNPFLDELLPPR